MKYNIHVTQAAERDMANAYSDEGWYVEKTTFADNRQAAGEQIDKTSYSANYHIHADNALAESQDQAAKGNVEISKIVSSSGQSNGLELEGAGFTLACRWQKRLSKLMEA